MPRGLDHRRHIRDLGAVSVCVELLLENPRLYRHPVEVLGLVKDDAQGTCHEGSFSSCRVRAPIVLVEELQVWQQIAEPGFLRVFFSHARVA